MADSQNKGGILDDGENNTIVADSEFPEPRKLTREGWETVCLIW